MFAQHMIATCKDKGMVCTVMPHGVLFRGGAEKEIRTKFLREDLLEAVIALPQNLFYGASIPACLLVMRPNHYFQQWYMDDGAAWLRSRSADLARLSGQTSSRVIVGDLGFRWGSCGKNGTLYFNWRLLQLPIQVIDYVVLHEQVHLLHHNHSPHFWGAMDSVLPDWRDRKEELERDWGRFARFAMATVSSGPVKSRS